MKTIILSEVDSTNEYAKTLTDVEEWTAVISFGQTGGKGTKGRSFISPVGGLYMSIVVYPDGERLKFLTAMAAVAVRRAIKGTFNIDCGIKWVNDLYLNDKKVCGILTENRFERNNVVSIVGIGVDVFRPVGGYGEYDGVAGYLVDRPYDKEKIIELADDVRKELISVYNDVDGKFLHEYAENSVLTGKTVELKRGEVTDTVTVVGIDSEAHLIVKHIDSGIETVINGDIIWKK